MNAEIVEKLRGHGIQPSAQRVAVAEYILATDEHPSAERVLARVKRRFPMVSRATVYNTLNLFVEKGLVQQLVLTGGRVVFDPWVEDHHHFIDEATGKIHDIPWDAIEVKRVDRLKGFDVRKFHVVLKGRRRG
ncbi:MAG: transcriptional repressor [Deltaproteobacteria bacterium]|nr:transcriptional repressor [Deltaproteobacteria bacterium]